MFDMHIEIGDISISSVEKEDVLSIQKWMNDQENDVDVLPGKNLNVEEFLERFIEYYVSENEFFLKIKQKTELIGIFKGRVEFKNPNEVIIWCFMLDHRYRALGIGSKVLESALEHFRNNLGISNFSTGVMEGDNRVLKFWNKNKFKLLRISKNFFDIEGKSADMLILKRYDEA